MKLPPGLEPSPTNSTSRADGGIWLAIELDGGRVYLDDAGELFALPEHAAIRDRLVDALNASGARRGSAGSAACAACVLDTPSHPFLLSDGLRNKR